MKANELRIGNYVTWRDEESKDSILTVTGIVLNDCVWVEWEWEDGEKDYTECDFDGLKPILITEDWLIKLGFYEYDRMGENIFFSMKQYNDMNWNLHFNRNILTVSFKDLVWNKSFEINYVHQLQNLFYCLCGYELTIKE
jgi:hypothetical protein